MSHFIAIEQQKPNRIEDVKDEKYHVDYARWAISTLSHRSYQKFLRKSLLNWHFFKGDQWILEDDLTAFFMDESGNARNRIKLVKNLVRPTVEQYVGNAIRLQYTARAISSSEFAINRRDTELGRSLFFTRMANEQPDFQDMIRDTMNIGKTEQETKAIFENLYQDELQPAMNNIIKYQEGFNRLSDLKVVLSRHLTLDGVCVAKGWAQNGEYMFKNINPMFWFWDMSAKDPDLRDSEFMGEWSHMLPPDIFERFQDISADDRKAIEKHTQNNATSDLHRLVYHANGMTGARVPVYETYWKDLEVQEYGYVKDAYGYEYFARINGENSEFTDEDLIEPTAKVFQDVLKGKLKTKIYVDVLRYCIFIPREEVEQAKDDIILEHGKVPYQESYALDPQNVEFPYKVHTWNYNMGEILSPIDDMIDPQRFINRMMSVAENQVNNSRGSGSIIDKGAVDPDDGEEGVEIAMNSNRTIFLDAARVGGVNQAIGSYDNTVGAGTLNLFNVISEVQRGISDVTAVNEAMTGTQGGARALVGVLESQIQRGSLVQEPFYYALTNVLDQIYRSIASVGKRVYVDNPRKLAIIIGDAGAATIEKMERLKLEDFRLFITRTASEETQRQEGNGLLFTLMQAGLIDEQVFSNLYGRSSVEEIADALRKFQGEMAEAKRLQAEQNAQRSESIIESQRQADAAAQQEQFRQEGRDDNKDTVTHVREMDKITTRGKLQTDSKIQAIQTKAAVEKSKE